MDAHSLYQKAYGEYLSRVKTQFNQSLTVMMLWVVVLGAVFFAQDVLFNTQAFAITPQSKAGLIGVLSAPLLHGSFEHLASNAFAFLILGTLAGSLYPRASLIAWPVIWIGSGLGTWFISIGGHHIGASGITVGLMFFLIGQGLKRRDRTSLIALMMALFFFGGMVLSVLPREQGISWEYHLSGALFGLLTGLLLSSQDAQAPKRLYSWDIEEHSAGDDQRQTELEPPSPQDVPVLWHHHPATGRKVIVFRRPRGN